ncbi:hypothetical protein FZC83_20130 [Rossellomorea marisflavi]|uniref:Uncharacterized protein n=1 Tax=Rossellomorea marisflavi TaxID=189381 RepID=A0A5D4RDT1_9BACI|nr:hypothetical protein [Rossellomorea marisflavi]TYS49555.1 hypothetical protein FZC83_20130 [Rossellomorea marisflavi]
MLDTVRSEDHADYHFSTSVDIRVGLVQPSWSYGEAFIDQESDALEQTDEWYAVVYQDDKPVNVMAAAKNENGKYAFMGIGFGQDLAVALDMAGHKTGKRVYEFPNDAWFMIDEDSVYGLNQPAKSLIGKEDWSLTRYMEYVHERYSDLEVIMEDGQNAATGGAGALPEQEGSERSGLVYVGLGILIMAGVVMMYRMMRKRSSESYKSNEER